MMILGERRNRVNREFLETRPICEGMQMNEQTKRKTKLISASSPPEKAAAPPPDIKPVAAKVGVKKGVKKTKRRGRKKERTQISVRIDKTVMEIAHRQMEGTGMRITDLIERGLLLAIREMGDLDPVVHHLRLILHDEGVEFSRFMLNARAWRRLPEIHRSLSPLEKLAREHYLALNEAVLLIPGIHDVMNLPGTPQDSRVPAARQA
jgi:uncharacterized protein (DUF4415 family)